MTLSGGAHYHRFEFNDIGATVTDFLSQSGRRTVNRQI